MDVIDGFNFLLDKAEREREEKRLAEARRVAQSRAEMVKKIFEAIELLANAGQRQYTCLPDLFEAQERVERAIDAFAKMDPEEYEEYERHKSTTPRGTNHDLTVDQRLDMPRTL